MNEHFTGLLNRRNQQPVVAPVALLPAGIKGTDVPAPREGLYGKVAVPIFNSSNTTPLS